MYLDRVKTITTKTNGNDALEFEPLTEANRTNYAVEKNQPVFDKWKDWHASEISHHGKLCCEIAREWLTANDYSELGSNSVLTGPRWLRQRFKWGASSFPIFWCEAVRRDTLDCGALAALAAEIFKSRGVRNYRVQMVQRFSETATSQWQSSWNLGDEPLRWTAEDLIYHEGCAIAADGDGAIKIWDASAGWWVDSNPKDGYGALLAIRVSDHNLPPNTRFVWGNHAVEALKWTRVGWKFGSKNAAG